MLYGVGEIVLVVIGILIALQINNWNGNRVNNLKAEDYAKSLLLETEENVKIFDDRIGYYYRQLELTKHYMALLNAPSANDLPNDTLIAMAMVIGPISTRALHKSVYDDIIFSGALQFITSSVLREKITQLGRFFDTYDESRQRTARNWQELQKYYQNYHTVPIVIESMTGYDLPDLALEIDREAFIHSRDFANLLAARIYRCQASIGTSEQMKTYLEDLKRELEDSLGYP